MNIAFIPVRGGSRSIPLKNIKEINGMPLVYWTAKAASDCKEIDRVYVCTEDDRIKNTVEAFRLPKVEVAGRSAESASDMASTEFVMLEFAENHDFDNIALIQATSPILTAGDLTGGFSLFYRPGCDSVVTVVRQFRLLWKQGSSGYIEPLNYNPLHRKRRQDADWLIIENGSFFITSKEALLSSKCRISGNILAYEMPADAGYELDEPIDWIIVEQLMKNRQLKP